MPYTYQTFLQAQANLAARLYDATQTFWPPTELQIHLIEALRTWNAFTSFWRDSFTFTSVPGQTWYDIPGQTNSIRPYTVTDNALLVAIEQHLLEPSTTAYPLAWGGSAQFSVSDLLGAIQRRRDEVLSATGCTLTRNTLTASNGLIGLADNVIDLRRVAWLPTSGSGFANTALRPSDTWELQSFQVGYTTTTGPPSTYFVSTEAPLEFNVNVQALPTGGLYEVLSVNAGPDLSPNVATLLGVPDDWSWAIKWGALSDLFGRESSSKDAPREAYCDQRFTEALGLMFDSPAVLGVLAGGVPLQFDSVRNGDDFQALWQAKAAGPAQFLYLAGLNLVALSPAPLAGQPITLTVVENAPIPTGPGSLVQLGRDDYDAVLDYAQHLASLKMGGMEFMATLPLYKAFLRRAALYNSKLTSLGSFQRDIYEISSLESERNPVYDSPEVIRGAK